MSSKAEAGNLIDGEIVDSLGLAIAVIAVAVITILPLTAGLAWFFFGFYLVNGLTNKHEKSLRLFYLCVFSLGIVVVNSHLFAYVYATVNLYLPERFLPKFHQIGKLIYYSFVISTFGSIILLFSTQVIGTVKGKKLNFKHAQLKFITLYFSGTRPRFIVLITGFLATTTGLYLLNLYALVAPMLSNVLSPSLWANLKIYPMADIAGINWLLLHVLATFSSLILAIFMISAAYIFCTRKILGAELSDDEAGIVKHEVKSGKGMYIGDLDNIPKHLGWKDINHHVHVLGQIGAGKSILLRNIYSHQILAGKGLLMIDLKGEFELKDEFKALYLSSGRTSGFGIFDVSNPSASVKYNPLLRGNSTELKDKFMLAFTWSEEYYRKQAESFLLLVFNAVVIVRDELNELMTIKDVLDLLVEPKSLLHLAEKLPEKHAEVKKDLEHLFIKFTNPKVGVSSLSGLKTDLELIVKSSLGSMVCSNDSLNLLDVIQKKQVLLVSLDGQRFGETAKRISRMFISDLKSCSGYISNQVDQEDRPNFTVIVDEFADIISSKESGEMFASLLNRSRSSGIGCVVAHQSLGDFEDERVMKQIIDNTGTLITFVQKDDETAEKVSKMIGTKEVYKTTKQTKRELFYSRNTGAGSVRSTEQFHIHPNVIKNLSIGEAVYLTKKPTSFGKLKVRFLGSTGPKYSSRDKVAQEFLKISSQSNEIFKPYTQVPLSSRGKVAVTHGPDLASTKLSRMEKLEKGSRSELMEIE